MSFRCSKLQKVDASRFCETCWHKWRETRSRTVGAGQESCFALSSCTFFPCSATLNIASYHNHRWHTVKQWSELTYLARSWWEYVTQFGCFSMWREGRFFPSQRRLDPYLFWIADVQSDRRGSRWRICSECNDVVKVWRYSVICFTSRSDSEEFQNFGPSGKEAQMKHNCNISRSPINFNAEYLPWWYRRLLRIHLHFRVWYVFEAHALALHSLLESKE